MRTYAVYYIVETRSSRAYRLQNSHTLQNGHTLQNDCTLHSTRPPPARTLSRSNTPEPQKYAFSPTYMPYLHGVAPEIRYAFSYSNHNTIPLRPCPLYRPPATCPPPPTWRESLKMIVIVATIAATYYCSTDYRLLRLIDVARRGIKYAQNGNQAVGFPT